MRLRPPTEDAIAAALRFAISRLADVPLDGKLVVVTEMQARAIFEAAVQVAKKGVKVIPEVMIPLIGSVEEFENQKEIVVQVAEEVLGKAGTKDLKYLVGTMIEIPRAALTARRAGPGSPTCPN